ncbi:MAG TPA: zinc-binding dehydrogenase [Solirubrobacteraceae bacterium]|nr:zinc-binding dehydrogenase [Solirubrobacteraceae bacterium]
MRAIVITKHGPPEVLQVQERPSPAIGPGRVRIQVAAAGVNFADTMARVGLYEDAPPPPCIVGYEVAGTVTELGPDTDGPAVGTRVMAGTRFGGYAEEVVVPVADAIPLADGLSFEQGAAIPVNYATAWAGLVEYGGLSAGARVLIHAAAGGVGIAATQIARRTGAELWGTASPGKHAAIREQGIDHPLDYTREGWTDGLPGFDIVLDGIGGASFRRSYRLLRPGGRLVAIGASSVMSGERRNLARALPQALRMMRGFDLIKQMADSKTIVGLNMLRLWDERGSLERWITPLQEMLRDGSLAPVVSDVVPFDRAPEAHRIIGERRNVGKVVLVP